MIIVRLHENNITSNTNKIKIILKYSIDVSVRLDYMSEETHI